MDPAGRVERLRIGVLIPSTNTVVEPEYYDMLPPGVTAHAGRMLVTQPDTSSDQLYDHLSEQMLVAVEPTLRNLATCRPAHIGLCMSAVSFAGGVKGEISLRERLEEIAGVPVSTGPLAMLAALQALGTKRIVFLSPFQPHSQSQAVEYFEEQGISVVGNHSFLSPSTTAIAEVSHEEIRAAIRHNDTEDADAIVQGGTNLRMARLAAAAEWWLGKPVVHVNTAMAWFALRQHGIDDRVDGFGSLLAEH
jgi:maleate isomerase